MAIDTPGEKHEWLIALLLVACVVTVGFWEIMARRSSRAFQPFYLTASNFRGFLPDSESWSVRSLPVGSDSIEPNIVVCEVRQREGNLPDTPVLVRLVHGYNMPDCMRIKGYKVELMEDSRRGQKLKAAAGNHNIQIWRLTSATGDMSIWITGMLKAGDFSETDVDVRTMAFPRIGIPDDPSWLPRGLTLKSLRHPISNFRLLLRAKWNNARCDLATFFKLRQPAWANEELLTLVAASPAVVMTSGDEGADHENDRDSFSATRAVEAYEFMLSELQKWRTKLNNTEMTHSPAS